MRAEVCGWSKGRQEWKREARQLEKRRLSLLHEYPNGVVCTCCLAVVTQVRQGPVAASGVSRQATKSPSRIPGRGRLQPHNANITMVEQLLPLSHCCSCNSTHLFAYFPCSSEPSIQFEELSFLELFFTDPYRYCFDLIQFYANVSLLE